MAFSQSDLAKLDAAIAAGVKRVKYSDKEVEYQSLDDMLTARELMKRELGLVKNPSRLRATFNKGLCG